MVEEIRAWQTIYGSIHGDKDSAHRAEQEETLLEFSQELRDGLGMPLTYWIDKFGAEWAKVIFEHAMLLNQLFDKYKRV